MLKYVHGKDDQKAQLFENDDFISLIITLNKIPEKAKNYKPMPVYVSNLFLSFLTQQGLIKFILFSPLPHPLHDENIEVCFFVKDPIKQYKEMFEQVGVSPKKVSSDLRSRSRFGDRDQSV